MMKSFSTAIYAILKPLTGLMLSNGIAFGDFLKLVKRVYVEETENKLLATGQEVTTSRIAIITGLTRREVAALRKEAIPNLEHGTKHNRATRVISAWMTDPEFCDESGTEKALEVQGGHGSFETLVSRHSGDMPYRAVLDELIHTKSVEFTDTGKVALVRAVYVPSGDESSKYNLLGEDVSLLITTMKHNIIDEDEEPLYQRKVCYDRVPKEHLAEFKEMAAKENQLLLIKLNAWLADHDMDKQPTLSREDPMKVGVGVYYFEEPAKGREDTKHED